MKKLFIFLFCSLLVLGSTFSVAHAMTAQAPLDGSAGYDDLYRQLEALQQQINAFQWGQARGGSTGYSPSPTNLNNTMPTVYTNMVPGGTLGTTATVSSEGTLVLITPDGNSLQAGNSLSIRWTSLGFTSGEKTLSVYKINTLIETISRNIPATATTYHWTIPSNFATGNYRIEVKDNVTGITSARDEGLFSVRPEPAVLSTPTLTTVPAKYGIKISWGAVTGANKYKVTQYLYNGQNVYEGSATSFTDSELECSKTYKYTIQAFGVNGASSPESSQYSVSTLSCTTPDPTPQKSITLIAPDDNSLKPGDSLSVRWTTSGLTSGYGTLSVYKGTSVVATISRTVSVTANSYSWTIPSNFATGNYRIEVKDNVTGITSARDEGTFTIISSDLLPTPKITVLSPNGQTWQSGTNQEIRWDDSMYTRDTEYTIYVTRKDGGSYGIIADHVQGKSFTYNVGTIEGGRLAPLASGETSYYIQIVRQGNIVTHSSNAPFSISTPSVNQPSLTVLSPNGGEKYKIGDVVSVKWKAENLPTQANNKVYLSIARYENGGPVMDMSVENGVANTGSYDWKIKNDIKPGLYTLRVMPFCSGDNRQTECSAYDDSNNTFEITSNTYTGTPVKITYPNGREKLEIGKTYTIRWTAKAFKATADVQLGIIDTRYSTEMGDRSEKIIANVKNTGSYKWLVPSNMETMDLTDTLNPVYRITLHVGDTEVNDFDASDNTFSIVDKRVSNIKISLSKDTPKSKNVKLGEAGVDFLKFDVKNSGKEIARITRIGLNMSGLSTDVSRVAVYNGDANIGELIPDVTQSGINSDVNFSSVVELISGATKTFLVKADIAKNNEIVGKKVSFNVNKIEFEMGNSAFAVNVQNILGKKMTIVSDGSDVGKATDSDNSPNYEDYTRVSGYPVEGRPDFFVRGVGKGDYTGGSSPCIFGTEPDPTTCKVTNDKYTTYYDHCASETQLNEAFVNANGKLGAFGLLTPNDYKCSNGVLVKNNNTIPSIKILSPNGGETFKIEDIIHTKWNISNASSFSDSKIELMVGDIFVCTLATPTMKNGDNIHDWKVSSLGCSYVAPGPGYKMRVSFMNGSSAVSDVSDASFSIDSSISAPVLKVLSPNGGEKFEREKTMDIKWNSSNYTGNVTLTLVDANRYPVMEIKSGIPSSSGSYTWTIPKVGIYETNYRILIQGGLVLGYQAPLDYSDNTFFISVPTTTSGALAKPTNLAFLGYEMSGTIAISKFEYVDNAIGESGYYMYWDDGMKGSIGVTTPDTGKKNIYIGRNFDCTKLPKTVYIKAYKDVDFSEQSNIVSLSVPPVCSSSSNQINASSNLLGTVQTQLEELKQMLLKLR